MRTQSIFKHCKDVYTDASIIKKRAGMGIYSEFHNIERSYALAGLERDINRAELGAIFMALNMIGGIGDVCVYSDSITSLKLIDGRLKLDKYRILQDCVHQMITNWNGQIEFCKVKAHSGNKGNDIADHLARCGAEKQGSVKKLLLPDDIVSLKNYDGNTYETILKFNKILHML